MAAQNAAATITPGADYAIWEDACRRLIQARPAAALPAKAAAPKTVLVIEASAALRETMNKALDAAGYEALLAPDAAKGMALASARKADLILTDIDVPAVDGIALIAQLRALPNQQLTPIMMLAAASQDAKKIAARRAGASGWIGKPFDPARFIEIVQKVCPAL
jgi:two-component system chemotaxis response regulator CheY